MDILEQEFYERNTIKVAKELLGKYLIHNDNGTIVGGKIVETEAYTGVTDKAAHVYGGKKTNRVVPMYGCGGTSYIYSIYGMYVCFNAITEKEGTPCGVLVRAVEPVIGLEYMAEKRNKKSYAELSNKEILNLTSGPSKLCIALGISKKQNNTLLFDSELFICSKDNELSNLFERKLDKCGKIVKSKRIGIDYAEEARDYLYRFYYEDNPFVSVKDKKIKKDWEVYEEEEKE